MPDETTQKPAPEASRLRRIGRSAFWRWTKRGLAVLVAVFAALLVTGFSIDLGPPARAWAEREGTKYFERPMHIGKLSALPMPGSFVLEDVVIEGRTKDERPFLTAKRISVSLSWTSLLSARLAAEVRMTDWRMLVETWVNGHSAPKLAPRNKSTRKLPFTTTFSVIADQGEFVYEDHVTPWRVVGRNLSVAIARAVPLSSYVGIARFTNGSVQIQNFLPMKADLTTRFTIDGAIVRMHGIDLISDGARSSIKGEVDFSKFPEMTYQVDSRVDFVKMKEIFFAAQSWTLAGEGRFNGIFHVFKGGRDLRGDFTSALASVSGYRFPNLRGSLVWLPGSFEVTHAESDFYGGRAVFSYGLAPFGRPQPANATFDFGYTNIDLEEVGRVHNWQPLRLRGRATGRNVMRWPSGHFTSDVQGDGEMTVVPSDGSALAPAALPPLPAEPKAEAKPEAKVEPVVAKPRPPIDPNSIISPLPVGGHVKYRLDPEWLELEESWAASAATHVAFHGRTKYIGDQTNVPFHVTSTNWQESDRVLVGILRQFGSQASVIEVGGRGTFDGMMTESFKNPRITGAFAGERMRAWDVTWGRATGDLVIQNKYVEIKNGVVGDTPASTIHTDGKFSLGYPRADRGEEIRAHIKADNWALDDFRTAFRLKDWPIDGVLSADISLNGPYERPFGSGQMTIDRGVAWREPFDTATGALQFEGIGLRISDISMTRGPGRAHGVMWIGWDKTYQFDADGDRIPVESIARFQIPRAPLSGVLKFSASGAGEFASPTYTFSGTVADMFAGDEGIGQVVGKLTVRNNVLTIDQLEAASNRLQVSGSGNIALNEYYDSDLSFRFSNTSIDPYVKFLAPQVSPYTRLVASGSVHVAGELMTPSAMLLDATVDDAKLTLLDYDLHNDGPVRLTLEQNVVKLVRLKLAGNGTSLDVSGHVPIADAPMSLTMKGEASLAILQGFSSFKYINSTGNATLNATVQGTKPDLVFSGTADIKDGRIRHSGLPRSLENINGRILLTANDINMDGLRAQMGNGDVRFGGNVNLRGLVPDEFNITATGTAMQLRGYPEGFESTVNAELALRGPVGAPTLSGTVDILHAIYTRQIDSDVALLSLGGGGAAPIGLVGPVESSFPLTFDIRIQAPTMAFIDRKNAKIEGHIDSLVYRGTLERPVLTGRIEIDRGESFWAGNRYTITRGSIDFFNPVKIEPYFDVEVETRLRVLGQAYDLTMNFRGTLDRLVPTFRSDPPLPLYDIISLVLGERPDLSSPEQRQLRSSQEMQANALRTVGAQLVFSPLSSRVGSVVEKTGAFDTVQIRPVLGNEAALQQINPGARVTLGKRIGSAGFLTYSRALNSTQLEVIVLEYDQSDRVSWVLSRNEDHTFALDFRIRHVFR